MPYIRKSRDLQLLLLTNGKIAVSKYSCICHITIKTDSFQHPGCIAFELTNSRLYRTQPVNTSVYSCGYQVTGYAGDFDVHAAWQWGHSPYPEIENMEVWVFGKKFPSQSFPLQSSGDNKAWKTVCHVHIDDDGRVFVDGEDMGIWSEFIDPNYVPPEK